MLTSKKFWEKLSNKSKLMAEFMRENGAYYNEEDTREDIFALYEEGARGTGLTVSQYSRKIAPNKYIKLIFNGAYENSTKQERKKWHTDYVKDWEKLSAWEREELESEGDND